MRSTIIFIDPASGTNEAVVGWYAETECSYIGPDPTTTMVGLTLDSDVSACEPAEFRALDLVTSCEEFGSNWTWEPGTNYLGIRPVNGFYDRCRDCKPAVIQLDTAHTLTWPPGFVPISGGDGACYPSPANPVSSDNCLSNDVGVNP